MYEIKQVFKDKAFFKEIEYLHEKNRKFLFSRDGKVILNNYSILYIRELWKNDHIIKYSYYWFTANNKLIIGWDNAPHHKELDSFPHHRHTENKIELSEERNLLDVIDYISELLLS